MDISRIKLNDKIDDYTKQIKEEIINENKRKIDDIKTDHTKDHTKDYIEDRIKNYIKSKWENPKEGPVCQSPEFQELPEEMILSIIEFMTINSICKFNSTCKKFQFTGKEIKEKLLKKSLTKVTPSFKIYAKENKLINIGSQFIVISYH